MELLFRKYSPGDEHALIELWNRAYAQYGGYVAKTAERWRWSILQHGAVNPNSILMAFHANDIRAYGAINKFGFVLEFAIEPSLDRRERRKLCTALVEKLEERARETHCDSISFAAPSSDATIDGALRELGYTAEHGDCLSLGILNPVALVGAILGHRDHSLPNSWNRRILIDTPAGTYPVALQSRMLIDIANGHATVTDASNIPLETASNANDWHFKIDLAALTDLVFRLTNFRSAAQAHRIEVDKRCPEADAEQFFNALQLRAQWYTPLSDAF
jgi:hypothetical protein